MATKVCQRACIALVVLGACVGTGVGALADPPNESRPIGRPAAVTLEKNEPQAASGSTWVRTAASLGGVIALIVGISAGVRALAKRGGGGLLTSLGAGGKAPSGVLEVLGRFPVGRGATLVLLKLDRRVLLVCQNASRSGGGAMNTLTEITDPEEVASILLRSRDADGETMAKRFEGLLAGESTAYTPPERQPLAAKEPARPANAPASTAKVRARLATMRGRNGLEVRA